MDSGDLNQEWAFSEKEIVITDTVIGKGAFGEVRVAKWRNIDVAAKRLHALVAEQEGDFDTLQMDNAATVDSFRSEMDTLSKLRHPNLVLFLGMGYNQRTRQPTTILTELLPESLYDIIETHKIKLNLPEIIDIALDVVTGLDYLHSHKPQIVHRDVSSKNILIGGNKAKIADLGQAKIFGASALSRQTSMPGAMAYSAPEVLTGKYTAKIDIFSFGILLIQMCCGEYPRIDRRERQQELAISQYPPLSEIINQTIHYQPSERPTAAAVCDKLREIKFNDRYYPPLRRMPPQCDIGVMARQYIDSTIEQRCGDVRIALEQTSRRLSVEEQRWRDEANKVDGLERTIRESSQQVQELSEVVKNQQREIDMLRRNFADAQSTIESKEQSIQSLLQEKDSLILTAQESKRGAQEVQEKLIEVTKELELSHMKLETVAADYERTKEVEFQTQSQASNTKFQLDMQVDQCRELEMRLEQTLVRWKQEKEMVTLETERCSRLRATCSALVDKELRNKEEVDRLNRRLQLYDSLPLPDEIKARFNDMEEDNKRLAAENEELKTTNHQSASALDDVSVKYKDILSSFNILKEESDRQLTDIRKQRDDIAGLNELIATLQHQLEVKSAFAAKMEAEKKSLLEITETIRDELKEAKAEVSAVRVARARNGLAEKKSSRKVSLTTSTDKTSPDGSRSRLASVDAEDGYSSDENDEYRDDEGDMFDSNSPPLISAMPEETRMLILNDKEKLRRYSINTRLMKVKSGEVGNAETEAFRDRQTSRFHKFTGANFGDLVHAATETQRNLDVLKQVQQEGNDQDESENLRSLDSAAKAKVQQALEHGGVIQIINCMWENLDNENITWRGARTIREQFINDDAVRKICVENKCDEIFIAGLTAFPQSSIVQSHCLRALGALVFGNDTLRRHCGEKGSMRRVAIALQIHAEDESVVLHGCTALTNLTHNNADNRARFLEARGVEALLGAMESNMETSPKIQRQSCWALLTLAGSDEASRAIVAAGGAEKIMQSMVKHKFDTGVQQFGCWAISNLALAGDDIRLLVRATGMVEVCNIALETHLNDMEVVRQARHAIGVLGPSRQSMTSPGGRTGRKKSTLKPIRKEGVGYKK